MNTLGIGGEGNESEVKIFTIVLQMLFFPEQVTIGKRNVLTV